MKSLREYLDIIQQLDEGANPWEGKDPAKAAAWSALTPEDQKWLGGADPTDKYILMRAPKKGAPAAPAAAPAAVPATAPAPAAAQPPKATGAILDPNGPSNSKESDMMAAADQADADLGAAMTANAQAATQAANGVNAAGQNVTMPDGTNPETGEKTTVAAAPAAGAQGAQPAAQNFDAMPFGKAFAAAKAAGMQDFTWKGKKYAVKMAPAGQGAQPKKPTVGQMPMKQQAAVAAGTDPNAVNDQGMAFGGGGLEESAYDEVQRLVSLIHYK